MPNVAVVAGGAGGRGLAAAHVVGRDSAVVISDVDPDSLRAAERELSEAGILCTATVCESPTVARLPRSSPSWSDCAIWAHGRDDRNWPTC